MLRPDRLKENLAEWQRGQVEGWALGRERRRQIVLIRFLARNSKNF
jgi:hypothetical protein